MANGGWRMVKVTPVTGHRARAGVWRLASGVYENALERPFYPEKCASKRQKRPAIGLDSLRVSGLAWSDPGPAFRRQPPDASDLRGAWKVTLASKSAALSVKSGPKSDSILCESVGWRGPTPQTYPMSF
jgi:hypothetical protein